MTTMPPEVLIAIIVAAPVLVGQLANLWTSIVGNRRAAQVLEKTTAIEKATNGTATALAADKRASEVHVASLERQLASMEERLAASLVDKLAAALIAKQSASDVQTALGTPPPNGEAKGE